MESYWCGLFGMESLDRRLGLFWPENQGSLCLSALGVYVYSPYFLGKGKTLL